MYVMILYHLPLKAIHCFWMLFACLKLILGLALIFRNTKINHCMFLKTPIIIIIIIMNIQGYFFFVLEAKDANTSMRFAYYLAYAVLLPECIYTCPPVCEQALFNVTNSCPLPFRFQHPAKFSIN